jgi:hypothetical protein
MTEEQWLAATDPGPLLAFLHASGQGRDRKLRLFAAACVRRVWHLLPGERAREAVEAAERFADGLLEAPGRVGLRDTRHHDPAGGLAATRAAEAASAVVAGEAYVAALRASQYAERAAQYAAAAAALTADGYAWLLAWKEVGGVEGAAQAALVRDTFGNPCRPPTPLPAPVFAWNGGCVVQLAMATYEERALPSGTLDNGRLAVLADALEEAGLEEQEVLDHLREPEARHYRGCWCVDVVLGRQ